MKRNQKQQQDRVQKEKFVRTQFPTLTPKNEKQKKLFDDLKYSSVIVAHGSAGTGKTIVACYHAARKLHFGDIKKIILIRAYQPLAGRTTGFLPGTIEEKLQPYYRQMLDYFEDCLGKATVEIALKSGTIEICSLETIRGRSWSDAIVIVDEGQNLYVQEVQALMTRVGENCQMIICGDDSGVQTDIRKGIDGLTYLKKLAERYVIDDCSFTEFKPEDCLRSGITKQFVLAFEAEYNLDKVGKGLVKENK